jgi:mono/diheme cytochrome c family protein
MRLPILILAAALGTALVGSQAAPEEASQPPAFTAEQIAAGAALYDMYCASCHGDHMNDPGGGYFDLRTFPPGQRARFVNSVLNGKNGMPPWHGVLSPEDVDHLFAYVIAGEKKN